MRHGLIALLKNRTVDLSHGRSFTFMLDIFGRFEAPQVSEYRSVRYILWHICVGAGPTAFLVGFHKKKSSKSSIGRCTELLR